MRLAIAANAPLQAEIAAIVASKVGVHLLFVATLMRAVLFKAAFAIILANTAELVVTNAIAANWDAVVVVVASAICTLALLLLLFAYTAFNAAWLQLAFNATACRAKAEVVAVAVVARSAAKVNGCSATAKYVAASQFILAAIAANTAAVALGCLAIVSKVLAFAVRVAIVVKFAKDNPLYATKALSITAMFSPSKAAAVALSKFTLAAIATLTAIDAVHP